MNSQQKRNALGFEMLENRHMLSATADIVLFVDESQSLITEIPWCADTIEALESALTDKGIGIGTTSEEDENDTFGPQ